MTSRPTTFAYKVSLPRSAFFPLDMLRYAESWPTTSADASTIERLTSDNLPTEGGRVEISLTTIHDTRVDRSAAFMNMMKRWESFGFRVIQPDDNTVVSQHAMQTLDELIAEDEVAAKVAGIRRLMTDTTISSENFKRNVIDDECASLADRLTMQGIRTSQFTIRALCEGKDSDLGVAKRLMHPEFA